jgi:ribosome maturation factor RimP
VVARSAVPAEAPRIALRALRDRIQRLVEPVVLDAGLDLDGLTLTQVGRRVVVRITVDGDDGVGHDDLSEVSRAVSAALDAAERRDGDLTPGAYTLELSSPGVDRPLTLPRHWRRSVGRLVSVRLDGRGVTARVTGADEHAVRLSGQDLAVTYDRLGPGHVQVEFDRLAEISDSELGEEWVDTDEDEDDDRAVDDAEDDEADIGQEDGA